MMKPISIFRRAAALVVGALGFSHMAPAMIAVSSTSSGFPLVSGGKATPIFLSSSDAKVVGISVTCLADDLEKVSGVRPTISPATPSGSSVILIGTIGKTPAIDALISGGKLDVAGIAGKWESFVIATVESPLAGVDRALVVAGSDRRGTAFGAFELSEACGVSPWVWWADVLPASQSELWVNQSRYEQGPAAVQYRGIFLNDEDWGLQPWAAKTFETDAADIGPKTYAKICELLLRLRANYLWPAMHPSTKAFNSFPANKTVADDYAIVMGSSHAEPMLRNNVGEWDASVRGSYNYVTNRQNVLNYWDERVAANGAYENIYTIGMRGIHDSPMEGGGTTAEKVARLQNIFADQRQILANRVNPDPSKVPQVFVPYKEVLDLYQAGLKVPDDVTIMWPDDNHGYIRQLPTAQERLRGGGSGIYYHISYWGTPQDYLWLCTTPPAVIWSEMSKAYDYGAKKMWVLNVGDLKPGEIDLQFFLELARDPEKFRNFDQKAFLTDWAARTFGAGLSVPIGGILDQYYRLNHPVRPEHLNLTTSGFSHFRNGDEADRRLQAFASMAAEADALESSVPDRLKAAYFELVLYPVRAANLMNRKVLLAERSRLFADQKRAKTAATGTLAVTAYTQIQTQTTFYNNTNAGGKWRGMMSASPRDQAVFSVPQRGVYTVPATGPLGVAVEGAARKLDAGDSTALPPFNPFADAPRFIDVFGTGSNVLTWTATTAAPWVRLSTGAGTTATDTRIWVSIDWGKAPRAYSLNAPVTITDSGGESREVNVVLFAPPDLDSTTVAGSVESNGRIEIEAERYNRAIARSGVEWRVVPGLGASGDAVTPFPVTFPAFNPAQITTSTPTMEYDFYTFGAGRLTVQTACLPTYPIDPSRQLRFAIALNNETPQLVTANGGTWDVNVLRAAAISATTHTVSTAGRQTLKIWAVDPTVVIDKFTITAPLSRAAVATNYEAEDLTAVGQTAGLTYRTFDEAGASATRATVLESHSVGQFVTLSLPRVAAGTYDLVLRVKKNPTRGIMQLAVAEAAAGPFTNQGSAVDLYASADTYVTLPAVRIAFATTGPQYLRFSVAGKNSASSNAWISLDSLALSAVKLTKPAWTLSGWRDDFFGITANQGPAADDADWDGDGIPNLIEYATGSFPTLAETPIALKVSENQVTCGFSRQAAAADVTLSIQACGTLSGPWETFWTSTGAAMSSTDLVQRLEVIDPQATSNTKSRFYRLRAERVP